MSRTFEINEETVNIGEIKTLKSIQLTYTTKAPQEVQMLIHIEKNESYFRIKIYVPWFIN